MSLLDRVINPIAKATASHLRQQARADMAKAEVPGYTSPGQTGKPVMRAAIGNNVSDPSLRRKPASAVSFETLRRFAVTHEISRICINARKRQISSLEWEVVPKDPEDKSDYRKQKELINEYFKNLGGYRMRFRELQDIMIEDLLTLDAICLYKQKDRAGNIQYYMPVDAATIKLRVDAQGSTPEPPEPAYIQYIRGKVIGEYTADQMIYEMMNPRSDSPYGLAPLESLILVVQSALKSTLYNLDYLTAGNIPEGFLQLPPGWSQGQIDEFMTYFDAMVSGDSGQTTKLKAIPGESKFIETKKRDDMAFKDFNDWLLKITCAMFDIQPHEIGFVGDVNRSTAKEQTAVTMRKGILPLANLMTEIFNDIIQIDLGFPELQFHYVGLEDRDQLQDAQTKATLLSAGVISIDEVRKEEGLDPIGGQASVPYISGKGVPVFLNQTLVPAEDLSNASTAGSEGDISATEAHNSTTTESGDSKLVPGTAKAVTADEELRKFKTYAVKRIKEGKSLRKFESTVLDKATVDKLNKSIEGKDVEQAKQLIDSIRSGPRFLVKAGSNTESQDYPPNPYLEELIGTEAFAKFESEFKQAIESQAAWTAGQLSELEDQLLVEDFGLTQQTQIRAYLDRNMPVLADKVDSSLVAAWYLETTVKSVAALYSKLGTDVVFDLRSPTYQAMLDNKATQLLTKSTIDQTTKKQLSDLIIKDRQAGMTIKEIAKHIKDSFADISDYRANMIAYNETASMLAQAQHDAMVKSGVEMKEWLLFGPNPCQVCMTNAGEGWIQMDQFYDSGDYMPSAHVNCECGEDFMVTDSTSFWDGEE